MKKIKSLFFLSALVTAVLFSGKTYAVRPTTTPTPTPTPTPEQVCYCHNYATNPNTQCFNGVNPGHAGHVEAKTDLNGSCPADPQVPEFGLMTGALAAIGGAGSYIVLKRRAQ